MISKFPDVIFIDFILRYCSDMQSRVLPFGKQVAYAFGMMGWGMMINLISVILVYLYLPPAHSGLPALITQVTIFGFFNAIAIITSSGRLIDAMSNNIWRRA